MSCLYCGLALRVESWPYSELVGRRSEFYQWADYVIAQELNGLIAKSSQELNGLIAKSSQEFKWADCQIFQGI